MTYSIGSRFGISLFANLSKAILSFSTGLLVARGLGPEQYGLMMFLLGTFLAIRQLLDMGSSTAFFTFLSQKQRSQRFIALYFFWLGVQFLVPMLAIGLLFPSAWIELIWRGSERSLVILAFIAAYIQSQLWSVVTQMGESQRLTQRVQLVSVIITFAHLLLMIMAWWAGWLNVSLIFILIIIEWFIAIFIVIKNLHYPAASIESDTPIAVLNEFWRYCLPLIPYACISFFYDFSDRWLLETYSGSVQQAYYSVAYQFGAISALATSSIVNIFWKEVAEAHHQNDHKRTTFLYRKVSRALFFVSALGAGFLTPWSKEVLQAMLGPAYVGGATALMVMFFYPLHQSIGQINGTMAIATGRISAYAKLGIVFMVLSIVVTYFLLAPVNAVVPGLGLGSLGIAIKMVVMQIISVNVLAYYLSRSMKIKFDWLYQPIVMLTCLGIGILSYTITNQILEPSSQFWLAFTLSGFFYTIVLLVLVIKAPSFSGLHRDDISALFTVKK